jgi:type I restriction enzyme S subunit
VAENEVQGEWTLPDGWVWTTLEEIRVDESYSITPKKTPKQDFELYSVPSFAEGKPEIVKGEQIGSSKRVIQVKAVLLCKINPRINRVWVVGAHSPWPKISSTEWIPFFQVDGIEPGYLCYFMQQDAFRDFLALHASGVGGSLMRIKPTTFADYPFPLAPLPEQRRIIAEIETQFTRLDAAVAALERAKANIRRYKAAVLQAACEGQLVPTEAELARVGAHRDAPLPYEPADQLLARILAERSARWEAEQWQKEIERAQKKAAQAQRKAAGLPARIRDLEPKDWQGISEEEYTRYLPKGDKWRHKYKEPALPDMEDLPELPNGWVWASLEQLSWQSGYGTSQKCTYEASGPPVLRIPNVVNGTIELDDLKFATNPEKLSKTDEVVPDDLLIIRTNGSRSLIGRSALIRKSFNRPHLFASYLIRYRLLEVPQWIATVWDAPIMREWFERSAATSAGQYNLSVRVLNRLLIPLPPSSEQHRIIAEVDRRLSVVAALEASVEAALARAGRLRQAVLKQAFEGRLVSQDPDDEPASVLLERIRAQREARTTAKGKQKVEQMRLPTV